MSSIILNGIVVVLAIILAVLHARRKKWLLVGIWSFVALLELASGIMNYHVHLMREELHQIQRRTE